MSSTAEEQEQGEATQAPAGVEAGKASHKRSRAGRLSSEITQEELSAYFHLPSEEACKQLGVGLTVLKRQCRRFGIRRWPFRKMKSLERLIENVETGLSSGTHARHLQSKSVDELLQQKQKLASCQVMDLEPDVKRLQQAFSKAHHKLRHMGAKPDLPPQAGGVSRPPSASSLGAQNRPDGGRPGFAPPDLSNGRPVPMLQASLDRSASSLSASQSAATAAAGPQGERTQLNAGSSYSGMAMAGPVPAARLRRPEGQAAFGGSHSRVGDAAGLAHDAATVTGGPDRAGSVASRIEPSQPPPQNHACQPGDSHGPAPAPAPVVRSSFMAQGSDRPRANSDAGTNAAAGTSPHTEPGPQSADMQPPKKYRRVGPGPAMLPPSNPTNPSALDPDHPPQRSPSMTDGASSRAARSQQPPQGASVQQLSFSS
ncbi:hypothetical protein WJX72_004877 [[Myrmecia] bisecta]|uniref:RWP-RK domain-containing protein n=1 Tax=[Myrmecia] bisecta TaxID=41462 RepID=A0AAW1PJZ6_9CHLO